MTPPPPPLGPALTRPAAIADAVPDRRPARGQRPGGTLFVASAGGHLKQLYDLRRGCAARMVRRPPRSPG